MVIAAVPRRHDKWDDFSALNASLRRFWLLPGAVGVGAKGWYRVR
jgi:hypothetical protein